ncbi:MAG TPA: hypothetical protein H9830_06425 [Candidatus Agrococcus pullicola]|uniref:Uncharacterized protein n=1 Tax=Candidatus Agrococcus pullicola TaxID=2838429 RepID=A0A9D1YVS3_9MICO|nr:hypothetical protein [Candidatus Agrococcus pullicola]
MEHRFTYRSKSVNLVASLILGIALPIGGVWGLSTGTLLGRRGATFSPEVSTAIFVVIILAGVGLLVYGLRLTLAGKREVVVTPTYLELPTSPSSRRIVQVPTDTITNVVVQNDTMSGRVLTVVHGNRQSVKLAKFAFDNAQAFEDCHAAIDTVLRAKHG